MKKKKNKTKPSSSSSSKQINGSDSSTFHVSIATTAVAQICHSVGYKATKQTALQTLTNVTVRYLTSLATSAANSAVSTGRTECNLYDVIRALEDVHADVGFKGNSAVTKRLSSLNESEMLKDVMRFVHWSREVPFAKPLVTSCGEKEVFTAVNEGESEGVKRKEVVPRGKQMVTSLYGESNGKEKLGHVAKKIYCGEKEVFTVVNDGKSEGVKKKESVPRGRQVMTSLCEKSERSCCGEKEVFTAVNEGESEGVKKKEVVPRGRQVVTSLCENEKLNRVGKRDYCGEKEVFTVVNEGVKVMEVPRGKQKVRSLFGESNGNEEVPRGRQMLTSPNGEMSHVPKWLPEFPRKIDCGEKEVFTDVNEGESEKEKVNYYKEVSELPEVRKKVRFEFGRGKDVNNLKFGVDLRSGVCKGGKRILCQIYEDDGEKCVNGNGGGKKIRKGENDVVKKSMVKKKSAKRYSGD